MKNRALNVLLCFSLLPLVIACTKKNNLTQVHFHVFNPVTQEGFKDVHVKIYKLRDKTFSGEEQELIWESFTDENGKASFAFKAEKSLNTIYVQDIDKSFIGDKTLAHEPSTYGGITKGEDNDLNYKIVHRIQWIHHFKNIACFDENDKVRMRYKDITISEVSNWSHWFPSNTGVTNFPTGYIPGCADYLTSTREDDQKILLTQLEVIKNDSVYYLEDTTYLTGENGVDTLKLYY